MSQSPIVGQGAGPGCSQSQSGRGDPFCPDSSSLYCPHPFEFLQWQTNPVVLTVKPSGPYFKEKKGTHKTFLTQEINWVSPLGGTHTAKSPAAPNPPPQHSFELSPNPSHVNQSEDKAGKAFQPPPTNPTIGSCSCACLQVPQESSSQ